MQSYTQHFFFYFSTTTQLFHLFMFFTFTYLYIFDCHLYIHTYVNLFFCLNRHNIMAESSDIPPPPKGGRSITRLQKLATSCTSEAKNHIEFDEVGDTIGPNRDQFMSYIGVQARRCISIRHIDWRQVPQSEKDHFWEEMTVFYILMIFLYLYLLYLNIY